MAEFVAIAWIYYIFISIIKNRNVHFMARCTPLIKYLWQIYDMAVGISISVVRLGYLLIK